MNGFSNALRIGLKPRPCRCRMTNSILTKTANRFIIRETVEAEITVMMPLQRARMAENRVRNKLSNGPRRVQLKARSMR